MLGYTGDLILYLLFLITNICMSVFGSVYQYKHWEILEDYSIYPVSRVLISNILFIIVNIYILYALFAQLEYFSDIFILFYRLMVSFFIISTCHEFRKYKFFKQKVERQTNTYTDSLNT